jgi:hypothetical protein
LGPRGQNVDLRQALARCGAQIGVEGIDPGIATRRSPHQIGDHNDELRALSAGVRQDHIDSRFDRPVAGSQRHSTRASRRSASSLSLETYANSTQPTFHSNDDGDLSQRNSILG